MELRVVFTAKCNEAGQRALALVAREPTYRQLSEGGQARHAVIFNQDSLDRYGELIELVGRWKDTVVYLNREPVSLARLENFLSCYRARLAASDAQAWCRGARLHETRVGAAQQLFPCRFIPISEGNENGWFQYGRLTREGVFLVNKAALRDEVMRAARQSLACHCPAFPMLDVENVIDNLPDRVDPRKDPRWIYREGWVHGRFRPVGVEKRRADEGERAPARAGSRRAARPGAPAAGERAARAVEHGGRAASATCEEGRRIPAVRYGDIGGLDEEIRTLREHVELPLRWPEAFQHLGIRAHAGVLLEGPPGTGKTLLAQALANECQAHFIAVNGPEILSKWHGESEANLRRLFEEAREKQPSVILFDELDALAPDRERVTHHFEAVLVGQFLALLDGLTERGRVVVVGTTNRAHRVDPALRRPGRFDLVLRIGPPDEAGRQEILRIHTAAMPLAEDVDLAGLACRTENWVGAELAALCREAGLSCLRETVDLTAPTLPGAAAVRRLRVCQRHFEQALYTLTARRRAGLPAAR